MIVLAALINGSKKEKKIFNDACTFERISWMAFKKLLRFSISFAVLLISLALTMS